MCRSNISIHLPLRGESLQGLFNSISSVFQYISPCGENPKMKTEKSLLAYFNTSPLAGRIRTPTIDVMTFSISIHLPLRGESLLEVLNGGVNKFQYISPCGENQQGWERVNALFISIHLPLRGESARGWYTQSIVEFQYISPCGENPFILPLTYLL